MNLCTSDKAEKLQHSTVCFEVFLFMLNCYADDCSVAAPKDRTFMFQPPRQMAMNNYLGSPLDVSCGLLFLNADPL